MTAVDWFPSNQCRRGRNQTRRTQNIASGSKGKVCMVLAKRILQYRRRRRAAAAIGLAFYRSRQFKAPSQIQLFGKSYKLQLPADHGTDVAFLDILLDDCYRLQHLPNHVESVLDIGAHAGLFSIAARIRLPAATIHAYEPNPEVLPLLRNQSEIGNFTVFPNAVALTKSAVRVVAGGDSVHAKIISDPSSSVQSTPFSEAVARLSKRPLLAKLDCEGAEWEILRDSDAWKRVDFLTAEYHLWAGYSLSELRSQIESLGFAIISISESGSDFGILTARQR